MTSAQMTEHNEMVAKLNADYGAGRNERVPITMASDEALWLDTAKSTFRDFYTDPAIQIDVMLRGMAWCAENIVHDARIGLPETWSVAPRWWMDEPEVLGCDVTMQENEFAWSRPAEVEKSALIDHVRSIDLRDAITASRLYRLYVDMSDLAEGMTYRDRPVSIASPGGTHGIFTIAARVRGEERLCLDMMEDPEWAYEYLGAIVEDVVKVSGHLVFRDGA